MGICIEEINRKNAQDINKCNGVFIIDSKMILHLENDEIRYQVIEMSPVRKRYQNDEIDFSLTMDDPNKVVFFAYFDGQIAGQVILRKNWNNYAHIEDIVVDVKFRRRGIGKALILQAKQWAKERHLAGIMLETQNNNVGACMFYERCGFQLEGFDRYLYKGIYPDTYEIALYWYWLFEPLPSNSTHAIDELPW
jgi:ribosomal protein S18 acetylase RimI-like enzyme